MTKIWFFWRCKYGWIDNLWLAFVWDWDMFFGGKGKWFRKMGGVRNAGQAINVDSPTVLVIAPRHSVDRFCSFRRQVAHIFVAMKMLIGYLETCSVSMFATVHRFARLCWLYRTCTYNGLRFLSWRLFREITSVFLYDRYSLFWICFTLLCYVTLCLLCAFLCTVRLVCAVCLLSCYPGYCQWRVHSWLRSYCWYYSVITGEGTGLALIFANLHDVLNCTRGVRCKRVRSADINLSFIMSSLKAISGALVLWVWQNMLFAFADRCCSFSSFFSFLLLQQTVRHRYRCCGYEVVLLNMLVAVFLYGFGRISFQDSAYVDRYCFGDELLFHRMLARRIRHFLLHYSKFLDDPWYCSLFRRELQKFSL